MHGAESLRRAAAGFRPGPGADRQRRSENGESAIGSTSGYTYQNPPTVTSISPTSGALAGGTSVTITGTNFVTAGGPPTAGDTVTIGGATCTSPSVTSSTTITCTTGALANLPSGNPNPGGALSILVTNNDDDQSGTLANGFTYGPNTFSALPAVSIIARQSHTAAWTGADMIVWGGFTNSANSAATNTGGLYNAVTDSWSTTQTTNAPTARGSHMAVWATTTSNMIVWGGITSNGGTELNNGGAYDPVGNSWSAISTTNAPTKRSISAGGVWTGTQMLIWAGDDSGTSLNSGGLFNPSAAAPEGLPTVGQWTTMSNANAPSIRECSPAVWTGTQMIVWATCNGTQLNTGGLFNPSAAAPEGAGFFGAWTATSTTGAPSAREQHAAVWTGTSMIVWGGGVSNTTPLNTGGVFTPNSGSGTWTATAATGAPSQRYFPAAAWTGSRMIVFGGGAKPIGEGTPLNTGGEYNPTGSGSWLTTTTTGAPSIRAQPSAVWTGSLMILWGGAGGSSGTTLLNSGGRYVPDP